MAAKAETPQVEEHDWQFHKSVIECNRHMLENGIATDVTFLVSAEDADSEAKKFSAHKYVLISRSPVFYSMLCGNLAETGEIRVTDIVPEAFRQMLNYIYTDDPELSMDFVVHVIHASKKYLLPGLTAKCTKFIKDHLGPENVCTILDQILIFEEHDLTEFCWQIITRETNRVLESEAFLSISRNILSKILEIETCVLKEVDVFQACLKWARQKCVEEKKEETGINIREALGECITQFRFSDIGDFARDVCQTGVLTKDEENGILRHLADRQAIPVPAGFSCAARMRPIYTVLTTHEIQQKSQSLDFNITFYNNKKIDINVISLLIGNMNYFGDKVTVKYNNENVRVDVSITQDGKKLDLKCKSQIIIKPGSSTLQLTYHESYGQIKEIYGVSHRQINLKDGDRISLDVSSSNSFIPLLGLIYRIIV